MAKNDAKANTVRDYLVALAERAWLDNEFSGKRPFGCGSWRSDIEVTLIRAGLVTGKLDGDGFVESVSRSEMQRAMEAAFAVLRND